MIIKNKTNQDNIEKFLSFIFSKVIKKYWFITKLMITLILAILFFGLGALAHKKGYIGKVIVPAIESNIKIPLHYIQSLSVNTDRIFIDIKYKNFMKLAYKREQALQEGVLHSSSADFVPARIRWKNKNVKIDMRLKGDLSDHWADDKKWSFRIKTKGDSTIMGMSEFSLQDPRTRGFLNDWFLHRLLSYIDDFIVLRYKFVNLTLNGDNYGIYLLEEHFDQKLVENNGYPNSPIIRIYDHLLWYNVDPILGFNRKHLNEHLTISPVDAFNSNEIKNDSDLLRNFVTAKNLLESFRRGRLTTHQVFEIKKLAKLFAILDLFGYHHSSAYSNIRFYYNPITSYLEPIGYDNTFIYEAMSIEGESKRITNVLSEIYHDMDYNESEMWYNAFFADKIFFKEYIQALQRISEKQFLDDFLNEIKADFDHQLRILYKTFPGYEFEYISTLYKNQEYIRNTVNPLKALQVYYKGYNPKNRQICLEIGNIQSLPVRVINLSLCDNVLPKIDDLGVIDSKKPFDFINFNKIHFQLPMSISWSDTLIDSLKLNYEVLGTNNSKSEDVFPWSFLDEDFLDGDIVRQKPNFQEFNFLQIQKSDSLIIVKDKNVEVDRNLIIPAGFIVLCAEGTVINLLKNATILSYSPFEFIGSQEHSIFITSSDSTGQGMILINTGKRSVFKNVIFEKLSNPIRGNWVLSGAVNFYNSPVSLFKCKFTNIYSPEAVSIVRSEFEIAHSSLRYLKNDGLYIFSSNGDISSSTFLDIKVNGLSLSNSTCHINNLRFQNIEKTAFCASARSQITAENIEILDVSKAIECKDLSKIVIERLKLNDCDLGLSILQEKSEYGPSEIKLVNFKEQNVRELYWMQRKSKLEINGSLVQANINDSKVPIERKE